MVQQTCLYFLNPDRLNKTADEVLEAYSRQYNTGELEAMEREIKKLEKEAVATVDLIVGAAGTSVLQKRYETKLIEIDERKEALESELLRLEIAVGVKLSHYEVVSWLKEICTGDSNDPDFREKIIDTFVNCVYIFDDRCTIFYNVRGDGRQISYEGMLSATNEIDNEFEKDNRAEPEASCGSSGSDAIGLPQPKSPG